MAQYEIMYWKSIPAQVRASDGGGEVSLSLPPRFQEVIDQIAMEDGLLEAMSLEAWHWSDPQDMPGSAQEVADTLLRRIDAKYPKHTDEMVLYIRDNRDLS